VSAPVRSFTLFFDGPDVLGDGRLDALFEAGFDDAVIGERDGAQYAAFDRAAPSLGAALGDAISGLEQAIPGLRVTRIEPDSLVTMAEIARRAGVSREQVRLLSVGRRGPGGFPPPIAEVDGRTRLWYWPEVAHWLVEHGRLPTDGLADVDADLIAAVNAALTLRVRLPSVRDDRGMGLIRGTVAGSLQVEVGAARASA